METFVPPAPSLLHAAGLLVDAVELGETPQRQRVVYRQTVTDQRRERSRRHR